MVQQSRGYEKTRTILTRASHFLQTSTTPGSSHARRWYWCREWPGRVSAIWWGHRLSRFRQPSASYASKLQAQHCLFAKRICSPKLSLGKISYCGYALGSTSSLVRLCFKVVTAGCMKFRHQLVILSVHSLLPGMRSIAVTDRDGVVVLRRG